MTPRFVPFESMSDAEQREHLLPGFCTFPTCSCEACMAYSEPPHTHDKPAPRPEENR